MYLYLFYWKLEIMKNKTQKKMPIILQTNEFNKLDSAISAKGI